MHNINILLMQNTCTVPILLFLTAVAMNVVLNTVYGTRAIVWLLLLRTSSDLYEMFSVM